MSELPTGWVNVPIGSFARIVGGGTPPSKDPANFAKPGEGIPWITPADLSGYRSQTIKCGSRDLTPDGLAACGATLMPAGTVLFSSRAPIGYVAIAANEIATNQGFKSFVLPGGFDPRFTYYQLKHLKPEAEAIATGTTFKELSGAAAATLPFSVAPLQEQTRIADQLDALLTRINACNARLDSTPSLLKRFRLAVLNAAVSGDLTSDWRALNEVHPWAQTTIGEMTLSSYYGPRFGKDEYTQSASGIPTIRTTDMDRVGRIHVSAETPRVVVPKDKIEQFRVKPGDLLVTRTGSIGVMAVFDGNYLAIPSAYLIRFRFNSSLRTRFAYYRLASPKGQAELGLSATAVTQPNVNAEAIKRIQLELPTVEEQDEIIQRVERLYSFADRIESIYMTVAAQARRLTPLTLAKAFRGELVQQNPQDEPASVLLQRIAGKQPEKPNTTRGRPRVKKPETTEGLPVALPDWSTLPTGAWAAQVPADEHTTTAQLTAVLKASNKPIPQDTARLATLLCLQPRLLTAALPADHAAQWRRLVGEAAAPLPAQVVTLQPAFNTPWRNAISKMRARGDLVESGSGAQGTWALGPDAARVYTVGWPEGRASWVVHYLQTHGVEAVLPTLATEVQEFVHARAA